MKSTNAKAFLCLVPIALRSLRRKVDDESKEGVNNAKKSDDKGTDKDTEKGKEKGEKDKDKGKNMEKAKDNNEDKKEKEKDEATGPHPRELQIGNT